jgi:hypothetical protein
MSLIKQLLKLVSKEKLLALALDILWKFAGQLATDALIYVKEAAAHPEWTDEAKRAYVVGKLKLKYSGSYLINLVVELAVGKLIDTKSSSGALKSAAILKVGC